MGSCPAQTLATERSYRPREERRTFRRCASSHDAKAGGGEVVNEFVHQHRPGALQESRCLEHQTTTDTPAPLERKSEESVRSRSRLGVVVGEVLVNKTTKVEHLGSKGRRAHRREMIG